MVWFIFYQRPFWTRKEKSFASVFVYNAIIRHCKNFVPSHDLVGRGLAYFRGLLLDWTTKRTSLSPELLPLQDRPPTRLRTFPCHHEAHPTPNSGSTSATSIFSSQRHQDRLPDDVQKDAPSRLKLHAYPRDKYNCSFRNFLGRVGCQCMFCFTK